MKTNIAVIFLFILISNNAVQAANFIGLLGDITVHDRENKSLTHDSVSGTLDLYFVHTFTNKLSALIEYVYYNSGEYTESEAERFSIKYAVTPEFNLAMGRFHTPLGNLNRTQHHGTLLQDTVNRPFFLDFHGDTAVLPLHVVGFMGGGIFRHDKLNIGYEFTIHSSQSINTEVHQQSTEVEIDPNNDLSGSIDPGFSARMRFFPDNRKWLYGLFMLHHNITHEDPVMLDKFEQTIMGIDAQYTMERWRFATEYFYIKNSDRLTGADYSSNALFVESTYSLKEDIKLVYRFETINLDNNDSYYNIFSMKDQNRHVAAIRYDINDNHALKFEVETIDYKAQIPEDTTSLYMQWSFLLN